MQTGQGAASKTMHAAPKAIACPICQIRCQNAHLPVRRPAAAGHPLGRCRRVVRGWLLSITISMQLLAQPIASAPTPGQTLAQDTLVSWTLTASIGAYMLTRWLASGGLRRHRETGGGLPSRAPPGWPCPALPPGVVWLRP